MKENQHEEAGEEKRQMTPEEIKAKRVELVKGYREEIKFLKVQSEYEDLLATIEESKYRRYAAIAQTAQLFDHMEREEQAAQQFMVAQAEAERRAAEAETNDMSDGSHVDAPENTPRKSRKLATS